MTLPQPLENLISSDLPAFEEYLAPWLTESSLSMIWAQTGLGKTWLTLSISMALAGGVPLLKWKARTPRAVLYLDGEMGVRQIKRRMESLMKSTWGPDIDNYRMQFLTHDQFPDGRLPDIADPKAQAWYQAMIEHFDVVVIDNLSTIMRIQPREQEWDAWNRVQAWAIKLRQLGKAIIFVHHAGKQGEQRGSSHKLDVMNNVLALRPCEEQPLSGCAFELHYEKGRDFWGDDKRALRVSLENEDGDLRWYWWPLEEWEARKDDHRIEREPSVTTKGEGYESDRADLF